MEDRDNIIDFKPRPHPDPPQRAPLINLPPVTKILLLIILAIQLGISVLPQPMQFDAMTLLGFTPGYYTGAIPFAWPALTGPFTFAFIHGGWTHVIMNGIMLAAFGAGLERWMGWKRMLLLMLGCSLFSAIVQTAFNIGGTDPMVGASGALSGLFAAALIMLRDSGNAPDMGRFGYGPLIVIWIGSAVLFGLMGGPGGQAIAWPAHIGGFLAGFVLYKPIMGWGR